MRSMFTLERSLRVSAKVAAVPIGAMVPTRTRRHRRDVLAALIPGDGVIETTTVGGLANLYVVSNLLLSSLGLTAPLY